MVARYEESDFSGEDIAVVVSHKSGTAALLPRSARRLDEEQMLTVNELQSIGQQIAFLERQADEVAALARRDGVSWSLIGFCLGITGEAARRRYGDAADE